MAISRALFAGDDPTPDSVKRRMALAELLREQGQDISHVDSPLEAIGSVLQSGAGYLTQMKAQKDQDAGLARRSSAQQALAAGLLGGGNMGAAPASGSAASDGRYTAADVGSSPAPVSTKPGSGNIYNDFIGTVSQKVKNPFGLAAIAATGKRESGYSESNAYRQWSDPSESGQAGMAGGIMSWRAERLDAMRNFAAANGGDPNRPSPQLQAQFFLSEDPGLIDRLNNATSVEEAQQAMNKAWAFAGWNRPGGEAAARIAAAKAYLPEFQGGSAAVAAASAPQQPVQVVSTDPTAGVAQATGGAPTGQPAASNQQVAQILTQGAPQPPPSAMSGVSREQIAQLLADPYTEDLGQQLLQQVLADEQARQQAGYKASLDRAETLEKRAYDDSVRREGYQREDLREAGADADRDRDFAFRVEQGNKPPTSVQEYEYGLQNPDYFTRQEAQRRAGAISVNLPGQPNIGTIPPGFQAVQDQTTGAWSMTPIPGGPAAAEAAKVQRAADSKKDSTERYGSVVIEDIDRAIGIIEKGGFRLPVTGGGATIASNLGGTEANDLRALLDTVKSNSTFDRLQAMRDASPTGAALGAVSDTELGLLQAAIGSLDQSQSEAQLLKNLRRVREITDEIVNGDAPTPQGGSSAPASGVQPVTAGVGGQQPAVDANTLKIPEGIDPDDWELLTPEERRLWQ